MNPDDATVENSGFTKLFIVLAFAGTLWALFFVAPQTRPLGIVLAVLFLVATAGTTRRALTLLKRLRDDER